MKNPFAGFFSNVRGDLFGGLTAGIVALPLALGFGVASGLDQLLVDGVALNGALAGLIGAIVLGIVAAALGGTLSQVSGPTGPMTVVVAGMVAVQTGDPRWIFVTFAIAGLLQVALGLLNVGKYIHFIPYPVISGFMTGIGVIIVTIQLPQALGGPSIGSPVKALQALPDAIMGINFTAFLLALGTIAVIYLFPRITKAVPGTLIALVLGTVIAWYFKLDVARLGDIPAGRPELALPGSMDWAILPTLFVPAIALALLASIDSLLTSLVADQLTRTQHDSRRELIGQGIANALSGLFGGLPGAGATMRTVVNVRSGGRNRLSGVTHGLFLLLVLVGLGPLAAQIPHPILAGILITVGVGIFDFKGLKHMTKVPRGDAAVMIVTLVLTVVIDLMTAVGVGLVMACILLVKRFADESPSTISPLSEYADDRYGLHPELAQEMRDGIHVVHLGGSIFFGNAGRMRTRLATLFDEHGVVFDMTNVPFVDQSGAYALLELHEDLQAQGRQVAVVFTNLQPGVAATLKRLGVAPGKIPEDHVCATVKEGVVVAVRSAKQIAAKSDSELPQAA